MGPNPLDLLDSLLNSKAIRKQRTIKLLKDPVTEYTEDWYMFVPKCFNAALDIKYTIKSVNKVKKLVRTQGITFSFKKGDILYNTPKAYLQWSEALKYIKLCVDVEQSSDVTPPSKDKRRYPGFVFFRILTPNQDQTKLVLRDQLRMSQDEFVKFLIAGPSEEILSRINRTELVESLSSLPQKYEAQKI